MKITILFFGILKDKVGENSIEFLIGEDANIAYLKEIILKNYPALKPYSNFSIAINEEYADLNCKLRTNDVVAFIPPVSGG